MSDQVNVPRYHKWAADVALSKKEYRNYYLAHYGCFNFCKPKLGSAPTVSILTMVATSILFFCSANKYLYFDSDKPLEEKEFYIFTTNNKWYLNLLTFFSSFFNATEMQMYVSNLLVLFFIGIPLEMVHGSVAIIKLFSVSFLSQIFTSFFFSTNCDFMIMLGVAGLCYKLHIIYLLLIINYSQFFKVQLIGSPSKATATDQAGKTTRCLKSSEWHS